MSFLIRFIGARRLRVTLSFVLRFLEDLWGLGNCEFVSVTFKSAAYVARYIMKKVNGDEAAFHYCDVDPDTGEILSEITPEFNRMSRRPGIGSRWLKRFYAGCLSSWLCCR